MFLPVSFTAVLFFAGLGAEELNAMCWMEIRQEFWYDSIET
jgi:hypothetical protein